MSTEIDLNGCDIDLNESEIDLNECEIDLNECEHFLKVNLDRSQIESSCIELSDSVNVSLRSDAVTTKASDVKHRCQLDLHYTCITSACAKNVNLTCTIYVHHFCVRQDNNYNSTKFFLLHKGCDQAIIERKINIIHTETGFSLTKGQCSKR